MILPNNLLIDGVWYSLDCDELNDVYDGWWCYAYVSSVKTKLSVRRGIGFIPYVKAGRFNRYLVSMTPGKERAFKEMFELLLSVEGIKASNNYTRLEENDV